MKKMKLNVLVITIMLILSSTANGITTRHDKAEKDFIKFGEKFPATCQVIGYGTGVLIDSEWVLTAAHTIDFIDMLAPDPSKRFVTFDGKDYLIEAYYSFPEHVSIITQLDPENSAKIGFNNHDIALIKLVKPVDGINPICIYSGNSEKGSDFVLVGCGSFSQSSNNPISIEEADQLPRGLCRAGTNKFDDYGDKINTLTFTFTSPDNGALEMESCGFPGDSGGPMLILSEGEWQVAGILSLASGDLFGAYGTKFYGTRVSLYKSWIDKIIKSK